MYSFFPQISDWLNLDQNMAKNYHVDIGDMEAIQEAINKQKVLRKTLIGEKITIIVWNMLL